MAQSKEGEAQKVQNDAPANSSRRKQLQAILATRLQAAQNTKSMTQKMQRAADRFAANIASVGKEN